MKGKVTAFGEIMMRLAAPDGGTIRGSDNFSVIYGGTEANVLAFLSALGYKTNYLTALPEGDIGGAVLDHLKKFGIGTADIVVRGDTLGLYFSENGGESRGARVIYYRKNSEFTRLDEHSFDYDRVLCGVSLFHISGISFALSPSSRALAFRLMREARSRGVKVSFDFNYRAALGTTERAGEIFREVVKEADILLASHRDLETFLRMDEEEVMQKLPCAYLILRDRAILAPDRHSVRVSVLARNGGKYSSSMFAFPVTERVGGGDAFNGAMLHAIMSGMPLGEATMFAISAFALKHTIKGDTFTLGEEDIVNYRKVLEECSE